MTLFDFSQIIKNLNRGNKSSEALSFFKENKTSFTPEQIGLNKYIIYKMIVALIETNNYNVIFTFIEHYKVVLQPKDFSYLLKKFKDEVGDKESFVKYVNNILRHSNDIGSQW